MRLVSGSDTFMHYPRRIRPRSPVTFLPLGASLSIPLSLKAGFRVDFHQQELQTIPPVMYVHASHLFACARIQTGFDPYA